MTLNEIRWAATALQYAKRYDDREPDVGIGPSKETLLDQITPEGMVLTNEDKNAIFNQAGLNSRY